MTDPQRRPLASRNAGWAQSLARRLAGTRISPNQISMASIVAAAGAGGALWASGGAEGWCRALLLVLAAAACQIRLICNLLDGLVAVEGAKATPDGAFWNEFPDRLSDMLILVGMGLGAADPALGWAAASFAVLTAYTRELGHGLGLAADFRGPMAKPHRMAAVTVASLAAILDPLWTGSVQMLWLGLWVIVLGSALTVMRRAVGIVAQLKRR